VGFVWVFVNFFGGFCLKQVYQRGKNSLKKNFLIFLIFFVMFISVLDFSCEFCMGFYQIFWWVLFETGVSKR
jgi:hypothetical protein